MVEMESKVTPFNPQSYGKAQKDQFQYIKTRK